jgi:hypothetical protein
MLGLPLAAVDLCLGSSSSRANEGSSGSHSSGSSNGNSNNNNNCTSPVWAAGHSDVQT